MEYILQNTDIFDEEIATKFDGIIKSDKEKYDKDKIYKLTVSFHVNLLKDRRWMEFDAPELTLKTISNKKATLNDKIYGMMSFQLERLKQILTDNGIVADHCTIQGDNLDLKDIIKIEIKEDTHEPIYRTYRNRETKERYKVNNIIPNLPYFSSEEFVRKLYEFFNKISKKEQP